MLLVRYWRLMEYDHTQYGYTGILTTVFMVPLTWGSFRSAFEESAWMGLLLAAFVVSLVALTFWFSKLSVEVARGEVTASFGPGKPHRAVQLSEVVGVNQIRNSWIQGWGIRKVSNGWMYNVWGLDAVELELASGDVFRIGTNEPDRLSTAISLSLSR
jgi:hypothetical protein